MRLRHRPRAPATRVERGDRRRDGDAAVAGDQRGDPGDAVDVDARATRRRSRGRARGAGGPRRRRAGSPGAVRSSASSSASARAIVDLPEPERPVKNTTAPGPARRRLARPQDLARGGGRVVRSRRRRAPASRPGRRARSPAATGPPTELARAQAARSTGRRAATAGRGARRRSSGRAAASASASAQAARVSPAAPTPPGVRVRRRTAATTTTAAISGIAGHARPSRRCVGASAGRRRGTRASRRARRPRPRAGGRGRDSAHVRVPLRPAAARELGQRLDPGTAVRGARDPGERRVLGVGQDGVRRVARRRRRPGGQPAAEHELEAVEPVVVEDDARRPGRVARVAGLERVGHERAGVALGRPLLGHAGDRPSSGTRHGRQRDDRAAP